MHNELIQISFFAIPKAPVPARRALIVVLEVAYLFAKDHFSVEQFHFAEHQSYSAEY